MTDPTAALEIAVLGLLRADTAVRSMVATRVFDVVAPGAPLPYVELGDGQVVADAAECLERSVEVYLTLHAYSAGPGKPQVRRLCGAVVDVLSAAQPDLGSDLALVLIRHQGTRYLLEADGLTHHGVVTFRALIDHA